MYELTVKASFSAAHSLRDYDGPCSRVHGHNWGVEVVVSGRELQADGMLVDFGDIKKATNEVIGLLDHRKLDEVGPFDTLNPTSENLARWIYEQVGKRVNSATLKVVRISS